MAVVGLPKDWKKVARAARSQGWKVEMTRNQHVRWTPPSGRDFVVSSLSPSDGHALMNHLKLLAARGFQR